jgi:hypothetical protein
MVASRTRISTRPAAVAVAFLGAACGALLLTQAFAGIQTGFGDRTPAFPTVNVGAASLATATGVHNAMQTARGTVGGATSSSVGSSAQRGITGPAQIGIRGTAQPIVRGGGGGTVMVAPDGGGRAHHPGRGLCLRCM